MTAGKSAVFGIVLFLFLIALIYWLDRPDFYLWAKALHVIAVISWMAGMLYLPRLFVYHCEAAPDSERGEMLKLMERRLVRFIMTPAMAVTWIFGMWLAWEGFRFNANWLYLKLVAVIALSALHGHFVKSMREFEDDRHEKTARYWRIVNETVTILMIIIVILVIVKPF